MYPYALFSMHLCLNLSTIKSQKKERKWQKKGSIGLVYTLQLCHSGLSGIVFLMKLLAHADSNSKAKPLLFENWFSIERFNFSFLNEMASKVPKSIFPVVLFKTSFYMYLDAFWGAVCGAETGTLQESGRPAWHTGDLLVKVLTWRVTFLPQMFQAEGHCWQQLHTVMLMGPSIRNE